MLPGTAILISSRNTPIRVNLRQELTTLRAAGNSSNTIVYHWSHHRKSLVSFIERSQVKSLLPVASLHVPTAAAIISVAGKCKMERSYLELTYIFQRGWSSQILLKTKHMVSGCLQGANSGNTLSPLKLLGTFYSGSNSIAWFQRNKCFGAHVMNRCSCTMGLTFNSHG